MTTTKSRRCQKCGKPTMHEEALVDGQIWCHPCADAVGVQHDDHIWLTVNGKSWAIERMEGNTIYLWRGYEPDLKRCILDVSKMDWAWYIQKAVESLKQQRTEKL